MKVLMLLAIVACGLSACSGDRSVLTPSSTTVAPKTQHDFACLPGDCDDVQQP